MSSTESKCSGITKKVRCEVGITNLERHIEKKTIGWMMVVLRPVRVEAVFHNTGEPSFWCTDSRSNVYWLSEFTRAAM